jgi:ABC-type glycerol-3-phosphate transport system substrate-binding protein
MYLGGTEMYKSKIVKISLLFMVFILAVSLSLFGCKDGAAEAEEEATVAEEGAAEASGEVSAPEEEVTLSLWFQDWEGGSKWTNDWIVVFEEKYPNISIDVTFLPFEEINTKLFPAIAAGNESDLMFFYDDWLLGKDASKFFGPVTPDLYTYDEIKKVTFESTIDRYTGSDGELYAIPWGTGSNAAGILYHKDIIDESGVDIEGIKTWDDLKAAAEKLTKYDAGGKIERSGILFTYHEIAYTWLDMIAAQGAADELFNVDTGEWNFNIPEAKESLEFINSFVEEDLFDPQSGDPFTAFPNKLGAMFEVGPWGLGAWGEQYPDLELDYMYMPLYPGTDRNVHTIASWGSMAYSKNLEGSEKDAALIFLKEILENEEFYNIAFSNDYWVGTPGSKTYLNNLVQMVEDGNIPSPKAEITARFAPKYVENINLLPTMISEPELIRATIFPEMTSVFIGVKTVDQVLDYLTKTCTSLEQDK